MRVLSPHLTNRVGPEDHQSEWLELCLAVRDLPADPGFSRAGVGARGGGDRGRNVR